MTSEQFKQFSVTLFFIILTYIFTSMEIGIVYDEVQEIKTLMKVERKDEYHGEISTTSLSRGYDDISRGTPGI